MKPRKFAPEEVAEALRAAAGIYSAAASLLRCSPTTVKNYVARYKSLQKVKEEIEQTTLDLAETKLVKALQDGNLTAVIFYLKCKGKARGFTERTEVTGPDGAAVALVDVTTLSDEELQELADGKLAPPPGAGGARTAPAKKSQ
jgi:hypothetical protein